MSSVIFVTISASYPTQEMFAAIVIAYTFSLHFLAKDTLGKSPTLSSLKVGLALLFTFSSSLLIWGGIVLWNQSIINELCFFAAGYTAVEIIDFVTSRYSDRRQDPAHLKKQGKPRKPAFVAPQSSSFLLTFWVLVLFVCLLIISLFISFRADVIRMVIAFPG